MPRNRVARADDKRLKENRPAVPRKPGPKTRYQQLLDGDIDVEDLDDEEVMRGRTRDKNGGFTGRPPKTFPRAIHDALHREYITRMNALWKEAAEVGPAVLLEIATNKRASADARVKAAVYLTERVMGKVPDKVEQTVMLKPFEDDIAGLLVDVDDDNVHQITTVYQKGKTA